MRDRRVVSTLDTATTIRKDPASLRVVPNLLDYDAARAEFDWDYELPRSTGLPGGGLNIAHEAVDRHAVGSRADRVAFRYVGPGEDVRTVTFAELARATNRFANVLAALGVARGDRVFTLLGRVPELHVAVLGALKLGAVVSPLFSAFGPAPVAQRLRLGDARVLVTSAALYRRKVAPIRAEVPGLAHVLVVDEDDVPDGTSSLPAARCAPPTTDSRSRRPTERPRAPALHERHDRHPEGRDARPRRSARPSRHRSLRARPPR